MSTVRSIEPLGITRACTSVPSMNRNARITQNQESASRKIWSRSVTGFFTGAFSTATASATSAFTMSLHFELHQLNRIAAGVARRAKFSLGIFHGGAQRFEREIAERIGSEETPDFLDRFLRAD